MSGFFFFLFFLFFFQSFAFPKNQKSAKDVHMNGWMDASVEKKNEKKKTRRPTTTRLLSPFHPFSHITSHLHGTQWKVSQHLGELSSYREIWRRSTDPLPRRLPPRPLDMRPLKYVCIYIHPPLHPHPHPHLHPPACLPPAAPGEAATLH